MIKGKVGNNIIKNKNISQEHVDIVTEPQLGRINSEKKIVTKKKRVTKERNKFKTLLEKNIFKIATLLLVLIIIFVYINSNKKIDVDENSDISKLNSDKYSAEISSLYNRDEQLEAFTVEMGRVQSLIGTYLISNYTLKENSFNELVNSLNNEINKEIWVTLNSEKSKYYNGEYTIDENGFLKFKFANKNIEPNWINDASISRYVILN